jgi:cardiolipin synthase
MTSLHWSSTLILLGDLIIRIGLSIRVIMRRRAVGVTLAWLLVIAAFPFVGAVIYLFIGETWIGRTRKMRITRLQHSLGSWLARIQNRENVNWSQLPPMARPLSEMAKAATMIRALPGNTLHLIDTAEAIFRSIVADVDAARRTCHIEFYIWAAGGMADEVAAALQRAASRGVVCRVLLDALGSKPFLKSDWPRKLRDAGVQVQFALPTGLVRSLRGRQDLRLHRKIVIIDGEIGYTGSQNLVDPRYFKQGAGVGEWVDAMVRVTGPAVEALGAVFLGDWEMETGEGIDRLRDTSDIRELDAAGTAVVQVAPSGPAHGLDTIHRVLVQAIYIAQRSLTLTTPYFVPDEMLLTALRSAVDRGVDVTIIVPRKVDSLLVRYASQAHKGDLLAAGIKIANFDGGLLHTKSVTIDDEISLFGSLNLDQRSFWLNFEITLAIYDAAFTKQLRALQQKYIDDAEMLTLETWSAKSRVQFFMENVARLLSPLL